MDISLESGTYIVAVSGGVDSIVLLDILKNQTDLNLIVAHFDHGIRTDSELDRQFVEKLSKKINLPFVYESAQLGSAASEEAARSARYAFLERARQAYQARAIVTAHHQDDVLETAIINLLRGTNRRGLSSLTSRPQLARPLLHVSKRDLKAYAQEQGLVWREDSTNSDDSYLRNYVRLHLVPQFSPTDRAHFLDIIERMRGINGELDSQLSNLAHIQPSTQVVDRAWFISLPHAIAREFLASWLRLRGVSDITRASLERLVIGAKVSRAGSQLDINKGVSLAVSKDHLALIGWER